MGYETTLLIGRASLSGVEHEKGEKVFEDGELYTPYLKDEKGDYIKTGKKETFFSVYATIDLCKCGFSSAMHEIDRINKDADSFWYWYDGSERIEEDKYGDKPKPVPIKDVISALEKDSAEEDSYRRFDWALALLKSMEDDGEGITVMLIGH